MLVGKDLKEVAGGDIHALDSSRPYVLRKGRNTLAGLMKSSSSKNFLNTVLESFGKSMKQTTQDRVMCPVSDRRLRRFRSVFVFSVLIVKV